MPDLPPLVVLVVVVALVFDFSNGWHDSANAIATVVSTRVLSPLQGVLMAAVLNFAGAFWGTAVAKTIGTDIADPEVVDQVVIVVALVAAISWNLFTQYKGLPSSSSHALIGGLVGAVVAAHGAAVLKSEGLFKVLTALLLSPLAGFAVGAFVMLLIYWSFARASPTTVNKIFGKAQIASAALMAFSHGTNDAQKAMGIITMALVSADYLTTFDVPTWVIVAAASAMALGTAMGGWKIIKTLGLGMYHMKPVNGFAAETAAAFVLLGAAHVGAPVSTTHTITSTIMGVGATRRLSAVRWGVAGKIVLAWVFTLPCTALLAGLLILLVRAAGG
ncbi:MAG: inorganic phosphate transporter [Gemmatimonadetes bacterium]|nr:inorganic phosphate transporter [Gemmatimonadota bacterium]